MSLKQQLGGLYGILSTSYCFYVLVALVLVEYYVVLEALDQEYSPEFPRYSAALSRSEEDTVPGASERKRHYVLGDATQGCRVRWSHPKQGWDSFNLPCPPAIEHQVGNRTQKGLIQVASIYPVGTASRSACVEIDGEWHCMPSFAMIGSPKSGSSLLMRYLTEHPKLSAPVVAETNYLTQPSVGGLDVWQYFDKACPVESVLPSPPARKLPTDGKHSTDSPWALGETACGEFTLSLLADEKAATTVKRAPWLRSGPKIVVLRDPVDRLLAEFFANHPEWKPKDLEYTVRAAINDYRDCACGWDELSSHKYCRDSSFANGANRDLVWPLNNVVIMDKTWRNCKKTLVDSRVLEGFYDIHLMKYLSIGFSANQFEIIFADELYADPAKTANRVFDVLGFRLNNESLAKLESEAMKKAGKNGQPTVPPSAKASISPGLRDLLEDLYAAHTERLNHLTTEQWGKTVPWFDPEKSSAKRKKKK